MNNKIVRIYGESQQYIDDFLYTDEIDFLTGVTTTNRDICFLRCKFLTNIPNIFVSFSIQGYAISSNSIITACDFTYDRSVFTSDALNKFYSPQKTIDIDDIDISNWNGEINIHISPYDTTSLSFIYMDSKCHFGISRHIRIWDVPTSIGKVNTNFYFEYHESQSINKVIDDYLALYDFMSFVNYSTNIPFDDIHLYKRDCHNSERETAIVHFFTDKGEYDSTSNNCLTIDDIPVAKIDVIFSRIASLRSKDTRLWLYYPDNKIKSRFIDPGKWLIMAISFEGLFDSVFPGFKCITNDHFRKAKNLVLQKIDENDASIELSKKELYYYNKCREQVVLYEGQLEEKFNYSVELYSGVIEKILDKNKQDYCVDIKDNYGRIYADYRNYLAHGDIKYLTDKEMAVYRILQSLIYVLLLYDLDLETFEMKKIIEKVFL